VEDAFPVGKQECQHKNRINQLLVVLGAAVSNPKCLVLDGPAGNTVRALKEGSSSSSGGGSGDDGARGGGKRRSEDIFVPNIVTQTFLTLKESGLCAAYHGSLR